MDRIKRSGSNFILLLEGGEQKKAVDELLLVERFTKTDMNDFRSLLSENPFENSFSDFKLVLLGRKANRPSPAAAKQKTNIFEFLQTEHFAASDIPKIASLLSENPVEELLSDFKLVLEKRNKGRLKSALIRQDAYEIGRKVFLRIRCLKLRKRSNSYKWAIKVICRVEKRPALKKVQTNLARSHRWSLKTISSYYSYYLKVEKASKDNSKRLRKLPPLLNEEQSKLLQNLKNEVPI